ncbi:magnesium transporter CorA family protein [Candidatus Parcubacteria bacterium]|nr:magnesium transporter CorA family protein [Patescibacteria group bacterium]MBU4481830.1 magnesium transporter CorA family protein [Patescibacteria group bacterium]MCG2686906.1 magnesium transporter CorA family protein [Candidatus Parcubacteria bacterium]
MNHTLTIKNSHAPLTWHIIDKPTKKQIVWIKDNFDFDEQDLNDCLPPNQRPKLNVQSNYLFMILMFPYYDHTTQEIKSSEIDFFITRNEIVLVHNNHLQPILDLQQECQTTENARKEFMANDSRLLYEILNRLLHYCFPMLNHINQDVDNIETKILEIKKNKLDVIREIMRIKKNIVNFRKIMQAHKSIITKLIKNSETIFPVSHLNIYLEHLVSHTKDIWEFLENYKETINALHETHESLLSHRLNEIIKTLTIFSVIVFPLTLMAAIFGMNTMNSMPFVNSAYDFWFVTAIMLVGAIGMLFYFKKKRWL